MVEKLWSKVKDQFLKNVKQKNKEGVGSGIKEYWHNITVDMCKRYVKHIHKVIPSVIASNTVCYKSSFSVTINLER